MVEKLQKLIKDFDKFSGTSSQLANALVLPLLEKIGWGNNQFPIELCERSADKTFAHLKIGKEVGLNLIVGKKKDTANLIQQKLRNAVEDSYNRKIAWTAYSNFENLWVSNTLWNLNENEDVFWKWNITQNDFNYNLKLLSPTSFIDGEIDRAEETSLGHQKRIEPIDRYFVAKLNLFRKLLLERHGSQFPNKVDLLEFCIHELFSRLIFIRTCEDRGIVRDKSRSLREINNQGCNDAKNTASLFTELCEEYKRRFNSELFENKPFSFDDDILKNIISFLFRSEEYGYSLNFSKINVDILGMIYEQYLKYIGIRAKKQIKQLNLDLIAYSTETFSLSLARKKKGVFFTPQYIVNFILEHTLNEMLRETKFDFDSPPKVGDISCGSGIFLVKAYEILDDYYKNSGISENEIKQKMPLKSLFAVDIDPKAVLSARLNLWIRYLDNKRQLLSLQKNFIADDSLMANGRDLFDEEVRKQLISDRAVAILKENSFDVIVGNPPYINSKDLSKNNPDLEKQYRQLYSTAEKSYDLYFLFIEEAIRLVKPGGYIGYIISNRFFKSDAAKTLRNLILEKCEIKLLLDFNAEKVFEDADTYSSIFILRKKKDLHHKIKPFKGIRVHEIKPYTSLQLQHLTRSTPEIEVILRPEPQKNKVWNILSLEEENIIEKLTSTDFKPLTSSCTIEQGVKTGDDSVFVLNPLIPSDMYSSEKTMKVTDSAGKIRDLEKELLYPAVKAKDIRPYHLNPVKVLLYTYHKDSLIEEDILKEKYKSTYEFLEENRQKLTRRKSLLLVPKWYGLIRPRGTWVLKPKILTGDIAFSASFAPDFEGKHIPVGGTAIIPNKKEHLHVLLALLNSKVVDWFIQNISYKFQGNYISYEQKFLKEIRIPEALFSDNLISSMKLEVEEITNLIKKARSSAFLELIGLEKRIKEIKDSIDRRIAQFYNLKIEELDLIVEYFRKRENLYRKKFLE